MKVKTDIMAAFLRRIVTSVVVILLLITMIFVLVRIAPGDPVQKFISPQLDPGLAEHVTKSFSLDKPVYRQYFTFIRNLSAGDMGVSYNFRQPVLTVIKDYFFFTLFFASASLIIQLLVCILLVRLAFLKRGRWIDRSLQKLSLLLYAVPAFVLGLVLVYIFSVQLDLFPTSGIKSVDYDELSFLGQMQDLAKHLILPLLTLSTAGVMVFFRYLRDNVEDIHTKPFIVNIKAMGVSEKKIFYKHIIPNSLSPLISIVGIEFGILLGGSLITEVIFSLPGLGQLTVNAIMNRDFPLVVGCCFIAGLMMIISNLIADLIKIKIDKRLVSELIR